MLFLYAVYGAVVSRLHGMGILPRFATNSLWAVPLGLASSNYYQDASSFGVFLAVATLCYLGKTTGHGNFLDLGKPDVADIDGPEKLEYLILWAKPKLPLMAYDVLGLSVCGIAAVLGAALAIGFMHPLAGFLLALAGLLKGPAYYLGYIALEEKDRTKFGEYLSGLVPFLVLGGLS